MQTIRVRTTQNVFIEYPIAGLGDRIVAFLIDAVILSAYNGLAFYVVSEVEIYSETVELLIFFLPFFLYHLCFEIVMNGQTPGKKQMRIKVVRTDGSAPTIGGYLMRWLFRLVEVFLLRGAVALITISANGKGQRLGDIAAGTTVVKLVMPEATSSKEIFTTVEEDYQPEFSEVTQLNDFDMELIQKTLAVAKNSGNLKPALALTEKIKELLKIETNYPPVKFLYTILKDHHSITAGSE